MLKLIASSSRIHRVHPTVLRPAHDSASPLLRVLSSLGGLSWRNANVGGRYFFCSDSSDGSDHVVDAGVQAAEESESKASAIVPTYPRPEDYLTVSFGFYSLLLLVAGWGEQIVICGKI